MELVDLYDENRIPLGKIVPRHSHREPGEYRIVIHVAVFNSEGQMLIQKRTQDKSSWAGRWDMSVGGGVMAGETSRQGADREVKEELGLQLDFTNVRPSFTANFSGGFDDFYVFEQDVEIKNLSLQEEEVEEVRWASMEEVLRMLEEGSFIEYPTDFIRLLFALRGNFGLFHK